MTAHSRTLSELARAGFAELGTARALATELDEAGGADVWIDAARGAADPDQAIRAVADLAARDPERFLALGASADQAARVVSVFGASAGLSEFLVRRPEALDRVAGGVEALPSASAARSALLGAVGADPGAATPVAALGADEGAAALRIAYRSELASVALVDVAGDDPCAGFPGVASALSALAGAALEAALAVARADVGAAAGGPGRYPAAEVAATRLAIIGMGKAGAEELNYVSDVDVIFVAASADEDVATTARALDVATRLAVVLMRVISEPGIEPGLWEVDPNLRPEGRHGALVRTLDSHLAYYERWAKSWEFQALLKARPLAGDAELGAGYEAAVAPMIWSSAGREHFVESAQAMRERVTANIPPEDLHHQLKLGPGGLRDVEFTVQLLQLVHGQVDERLRVRSTLEALAALADGGYIGRAEGESLAGAYRQLRVLEHRLQLTALRRTHLMPRDERALRVLARATGLAQTGQDLVERWERTKHEVRSLHLRLFYRPLLSVVAALPEDEVSLSPAQAEARLEAIGFRDPAGALGHIRALATGSSRRADIQRHLLPVMLRWFAEGADPDYGLLAFRRLSDALGGTHWFLRMLRDSSGAAERLTVALSGSRYIGELLDLVPESAVWLENDSQLRPRAKAMLAEEAATVAGRADGLDAAATAVLRLRRRETLRLALGAVGGVVTLSELSAGLTAVVEVTIAAIVDLIRRDDELGPDRLEFAVIGMGRLGGAELGFGSDADVLYVYRRLGDDQERTAAAARRIASELARLTQDIRLPLELDADLRPEGKNGPLARSLDGYRAYYDRWSLTWEAQALLRARWIAGDEALGRAFERIADGVRYPLDIAEDDLRDVRRLKARVEDERLPRGADPKRHVKLGRGSISDVEWFVQLVQLQHAATVPGLRTQSTLEALRVAADAELVDPEDAEQLREAWVLASRVRSAMTLWLNQTTDVLPHDRRQLDGIARILMYPPGSATELEEDYLAVTRRARRVFERTFYGVTEAPRSVSAERLRPVD